MPRPQQPETMTDVPGPIPEDNLPGHQPEVVPDKPMVPHDAYRLRPVEDEDPGGVDDARTVRFAFLFDPLLLPFSAAFGVLPQTSHVVLDDDQLSVRFGPWSLRTPRSNVAGCEVTGPYLPWKVAGPPRLSLADGGVTFATNRTRGVCVRFHEPVTGLLPWGVLRHPAATLTVTNPDDLARRLDEG